MTGSAKSEFQKSEMGEKQPAISSPQIKRKHSSQKSQVTLLDFSQQGWLNKRANFDREGRGVPGYSGIHCMNVSSCILYEVK